MFNILVSHCCRTWLKAIDDYSTSLQASLICYNNFIKEALLFGPVYKRNLRFYLEILTVQLFHYCFRVPYDVNCFIEALGDKCSSNSLHLRYAYYYTAFPTSVLLQTNRRRCSCQINHDTISGSAGREIKVRFFTWLGYQGLHTQSYSAVIERGLE